jgi:hypothetical protein
MVISYNQNLQFKVQCWKIQRQNYNSLHYIFYNIEDSHNNMDMEIVKEIYTYLFYWKNFIKITKKFHVMWKWNQNNKIKSLVSKKKSMVFYYKARTTPFTLPKTMCLKIPSLKFSLLGNPKSHHHGSKNNKNSKFKLIMFHD